MSSNPCPYPISNPMFVKGKTCKVIINTTKSFKRSLTTDEHHNIVYNPRFRKSNTSFVNENSHIVYYDIKKKVDTYMLNEHKVFNSKMQITEYKKTDFFKLHSDALTAEQRKSLGSQRLWTALLYLNDDFVGGETVFPNINQIYIPKSGTLLCWKNINSVYEPEKKVEHLSKTIIDGTKYVAVFLYYSQVCNSDK